MKQLLLLFNFAYCILHIAFSQQYGWKDISKNLPDYPFDTTIINQGEDTLIAHISDICFIHDDEGWVTTWHANSDEDALDLDVSHLPAGVYLVRIQTASSLILLKFIKQ